MSTEHKPLAAAAARLKGKPGRPRKPQKETERIAAAVQARLLNLEASAQYLGGVSPWTVRDLEAAGVLSRVRIPLPNGKEVRRLLFDRQDLDALIERWKGGA